MHRIIRRDDDQPDMAGRAVLVQSILGREQDDIPLEYFRQGNVKSYEPGRKTTGYVMMALTVAQQQIGRT